MFSGTLYALTTNTSLNHTGLDIKPNLVSPNWTRKFVSYKSNGPNLFLSHVLLSLLQNVVEHCRRSLITKIPIPLTLFTTIILKLLHIHTKLVWKSQKLSENHKKTHTNTQLKEMARADEEAIDTFMSITGVSEPVAIQKLTVTYINIFK